ncbi:MAG: ABC transporter substrate-binding protein [Solirubrobacteraceae bacterium]
MSNRKHARWRALKLCSLSAVCAFSTLGLAACGSSSKSSAAPGASTGSSAPASTPVAASLKITTAWPADVTTLDPANLSTDQDHALSRNIYQTLALPALVTQSNGSLVSGSKVVPYLAKSWNVGSNSITYHLRSGVHFYPSGDPLTAADVKFSLDRIFKTPGAGDLQSNGIQGPSSIEVINPETVKILFTTKSGAPLPVTATQLFMFSQHFTGIVDSKVALTHATNSDPEAANWLRMNAAGSGPYYIAARNAGVSFTLKTVPNSWLAAPAYKEVDIQVTSGSIASLMQSGAINYADSGMTDQQVNSLASSGHTVNWQDTGFFDMLAITAAPASQVGALANPLVRHAMAYAMPYGEVLNNVLYGRGQRAGSMVMPTAPEYTPAWLQYSTNLTKAAQLMQQAGNPKIDVPLYYLQGSPDQTSIAILVKANLSKIGINATLTPETQAGLFNVVDARSTPASGAKIGPPGIEVFNWSGFTDDPSIVLGYWATKGGINNYALYSSPTVNAIHAHYASLPSSPARTAAYQKAQNIIATDAPYLPIADVGTVAVVNKGMSGVSFSPGGSSRYWTVHPTGVSATIDTTLFH